MTWMAAPLRSAPAPLRPRERVFAGVPAAPINTLSRVTKDEHIAGAREMFVPLRHPVIGDMLVNGCPVKLLDTMPRIAAPAPSLGQDNQSVYSDMLGYTKQELDALREKGVV